MFEICWSKISYILSKNSSRLWVEHLIFNHNLKLKIINSSLLPTKKAQLFLVKVIYNLSLLTYVYFFLEN